MATAKIKLFDISLKKINLKSKKPPDEKFKTKDTTEASRARK